MKTLCLVTKKQYAWYNKLLMEKGIYILMPPEEELAKKGYDGKSFKGFVITYTKVKGYKVIDLRRLKNSIDKWTQKLYKEQVKLLRKS